MSQPPSGMARQPAGWWISGVIGISLLALYGLTSPPGLTWDLGGADGGDLAAAALTQGIAHPPGYPTYLVLAQIPLMVPLGSPAYRLNLFSAVCMAAAAALLGWTTSRFLSDDKQSTSFVPGILSGLLFGLTSVVWSQAVITEVYALAGLFCAALVALTSWIHHNDDRVYSSRLALLGGTAGIGLGAHYLVGLMFVFCLMILALSRPARLLQWRLLLAVAACAVGWAVAFSLLPLRAGANPLSDWGRPDTLDRFIWMVTGAAYQDRWQVRHVVSQAAPLLRVLVEQLGIPGTALAVLGLSRLWEISRPVTVAALVTVAMSFVVVAGYDSADTLPYLFPAIMALMVGITAAVDMLLRSLPGWVSRMRYGQAVGGAALLIVTCGPLLLANFPPVKAAGADAEKYGQAVISRAPPQSVIITNVDRHTFAVGYVLAASKRSDVVALDERLLQFDWYRQDWSEAYPPLEHALRQSIISGSPDARSLIAAMPADWTIFLTFPITPPTGYQIEASPDGLTYKLTRQP